MPFNRVTFIFLFLHLTFLIQAQVLRLNTVPEGSEDLLPRFNKLKCIGIDCEPELEELKRALYSRGFVLADLRKVKKGDTLEIEIREGPRYLFGRIDLAMLPEPLRKKWSVIDDSSFDPSLIDSLYRDVTSYYQYRGFPFAQVWLDSIEIRGREISARLRPDPGQAVYIRGIRDLSGELRGSWLKRFTGLSGDMSYSPDIPQRIISQLRQAGVIADSLHMVFNEAGAEIIFISRIIEANHFDGIIGLQRNPLTDQAVVAGYADLRLSNLFRAARSFDLRWERLRPESQEIRLDYRHPALIRRADLYFGFDIIKMDSSYINREIEIGTSFPITTSGYAVTGYRFRGGVLLDRPVSANLPDAGQLRVHSLGIGIGGRKPLREWSINMYAGMRELTATSAMPLEINAIQFEINGKLMMTRDLPGRWQYYQNSMAGWVTAENLTQNDLFLIGGLNSLRGFNERSFFAESFVSSQNEIRWGLTGGSYFLGFADLAFLGLPMNSSGIYYGWGTGFDLDLGSSGELRFLVGWGSGPGLKTDWADPRVHIGYLANF